MANTYTAIATVTVGSGGAANIQFTSIPQTYTDLKIVSSVRATGSRPEDTFIAYFNSDTTGGNYTVRFLRGDGSTASSGNATGYPGFYIGEINGGTSTASTFTNFEMYVPNYTSSNQKSCSVDVVQEANQTTAYAQLHAISWSGTSAISSITLTDYQTNNFSQYTTATLYGIKNS